MIHYYEFLLLHPTHHELPNCIYQMKHHLMFFNRSNEYTLQKLLVCVVTLTWNKQFWKLEASMVFICWFQQSFLDILGVCPHHRITSQSISSIIIHRLFAISATCSDPGPLSSSLFPPACRSSSASCLGRF